MYSHAHVLAWRRVRLLIDYRPALRQRTGVGEYTYRLASALVPRLSPGDELLLFSSSWKDRLFTSPIPGATVVDRRYPVRLLNAAWHRLEWPPIERIAGPVDVAHSTHPLLLPARTAAQVVTVYDLHFLDDPAATSAEIRRDYPSLAPQHARRADAVVVISQYTAALVESRLGVARDRIAICTPGAPGWAPRPRALRRGPILFVGTIEPRKNVGGLLDAYARVAVRRPRIPPLVLAGRAGEGSEAILRRTKTAPLAGRVRHPGYVDDEERERLYRAASVLVLPSLDEGFGMPVLEAMTIGVPVIASNRGALPEVVGEAGLLVDPHDPEALAAAIDRMLSEDGLAEHCAEQGRARARAFSWEASAGTLLQAYRAAVARRAERR